MKEAFIYGLFDKAGVCIYVGRTRNVKQRLAFHKQSKQFSVARILEVVPSDKSSEIERRIIGEYWSIGQARMNSIVGHNRLGVVQMREMGETKPWLQSCHAALSRIGERLKINIRFTAIVKY